MRLKKRCRYCPDLFSPNPRRYRPHSDGKGRRSSQITCPKPECQRQRHRDACRRWRVNNPAYDDGRETQYRQWRRDHPGYMKDYRVAHPDYVKDNLEKQHQRDLKRKNLVKRDVIFAFYDGRIRRLIDLVKRDVIRTPPTRVSEEIRRCLAWSYRLAKRDVIALQEKIAHNRGHESTP